MKNKMYYPIYIILLTVFLFFNGFTQTKDDWSNFKKYWFYRYRLEYFVNPAHDVNLNKKGTGLIAVIRNRDTSSVLDYGQEDIALGLYLGVMATEYLLLYENNQKIDAATTLNEIGVTLNAIYKKDINAENSYGLWQGYTSSANGFFIREDVPFDYLTDSYNKYYLNKFLPLPNLNENTNIYYNSEIGKGFPAYVNVPECLDADIHNGKTTTDAEKISQHFNSNDEVVGLLLGMALISKCLKGIPEAINVRDSAITYTDILIKYVHSDPILSIWQMLYPLRNAQIPMPDNIASRPIPEGSAQGLAWGYAMAGNRITGNAITEYMPKLEMPLYVPVWETGLSVPIFYWLRNCGRQNDQTNSAAMMCYLLSMGNTEDFQQIIADGNSILQTISDINKQLVDAGDYAINTYIDILNKNNLNIFDAKKVNVNTDLTYSNTTNVINTLADIPEWNTFYIILCDMLNNMNSDYDKSKLISQLSNAPPCGPYCYQVNSFDLSLGWAAMYNKFYECTQRQDGGYAGFEGNYVGLDYMLLYNLYHLLNRDNLPPYNNLVNRNLHTTFAGNAQPPLTYGAYDTIELTDNILSKWDITYRAGRKIDILPGFKVVKGANVHMYCKQYRCSDAAEFPEDYPTLPMDINDLWNNRSKGFENTIRDSSFIQLPPYPVYDEDSTNMKDINNIIAHSDIGRIYQILYRYLYGQLDTIREPLNDENASKLTEVSLSVSPNPFFGQTKIMYSLIKTENILLDITDTYGQQVAELVNNIQTSGQYQIDFNTTNLNSGIYFCTIQLNNFKKTIKIIKGN